MNLEKLSIFEVTRLISARALQISLGAPPLVKYSKDSSPTDIAKIEFDQKVLPINVIRAFPNGKSEIVEVN
ncbi:MAG: DNA-directed RNA polymerase subunit K [Candidatus Diapherotrites archaeon]|nr:DNA-directed RNA polymerase subunit K [Candidatus Diapherotrites archaeon]